MLDSYIRLPCSEQPSGQRGRRFLGEVQPSQSSQIGSESFSTALGSGFSTYLNKLISGPELVNVQKTIYCCCI